MSRRISWIAMSVVVVASLAVAATGDRAPRTDAARVQALASEVRCPTCQNLSAAESNAKAAQAVRDEIRMRVRRGETNDEIRSFLVSRFGEEILLKPKAEGIVALVWVVPVAGGLAVLAGLVVLLRRWKANAPPAPSESDRTLVDEALHDLKAHT